MPSNNFIALLVTAAVLTRVTPATGQSGNAVSAGADMIESGVAPLPPSVRAEFNLAPFYTQFLSVGGMPIVASAKVSDLALLEARYLIGQMIGHRPDVLAAIAKNRVRLAVMAPDEFTTDIPEHSDLTPKDYDPRLAALLAEVLGDGEWRYVHPAKRTPASPHLAVLDVANAPHFKWPEHLVKAREAHRAKK